MSASTLCSGSEHPVRSSAVSPAALMAGFAFHWEDFPYLHSLSALDCVFCPQCLFVFLMRFHLFLPLFKLSCFSLNLLEFFFIFLIVTLVFPFN